MALTTVNITGTFNFPDATWSQYTKAEFHLSGYDTDADVVVPKVTTATLGALGELDVDLWGNDDGLRGTVYRVNVVVYEDSGYSREVLRRDLGRIQITGDGPIDIATLLDSPVSVPGVWYRTITQAEYEAAIAAAASAAASAAEAALYDGPKFDTIALMALATTLEDGDQITVWSGNNGEPETFTYDASSTLTADGALVVDPTGMGSAGRLVSKRTVLANIDTVDPRTFTAGTRLTIAFGNAVLSAVDTGGTVTNTGGQEFTVITGPSFNERTSAALTELVKYPDGTIGRVAGLDYVVDNAAVGELSAASDFALDGVKSALYAPQINQYAAVGDDSADDAPAFRRLVEANYGGRVTLGPSAYRIASQVDINGRIELVGQGMDEVTLIRVDHASGGGLALTKNGSDAEGSVFKDFEIRGDDAGLTNLIHLEPSYGRLENVKASLAAGADCSDALIDTNPTTNVNQMIFRNVHCRSQANPGGTRGLWVRRGANVHIQEGYYGDMDECIKIGDGTNLVTNWSITGNALIETFDPQNAPNAKGLVLSGSAAGFIGNSRFQGDAAGHRLIYVDNICRGLSIYGNSFDGTSTLTAGLTFDGAASEQAKGVDIRGNQLQSIGGVSTNFIELLSGATPTIDIGPNSLRATGNNPMLEPVVFADGDTTPNAATGNIFYCSNTSATTITDFDGLEVMDMKTITVYFTNTNTTVDFSGTALRGNGNVDWVSTTNGCLTAVHNQGLWHCTVSG